MGCCKSLQNNSSSALLSLNLEETIEFEEILSRIPVHCHQEILNLPSLRHFINVYKCHLGAMYFLQLRDFQLAILSEYSAIDDIECLLSDHKDHFIFAQMHRLLSICYWEIGNMELAVREGQIALNIMLKHIPMDYIEISLQYFRVAFLSLQGHQWKEAEQYFMKSIEIARLTNVLQGDYIQKIEELLHLTSEYFAVFSSISKADMTSKIRKEMFKDAEQQINSGAQLRVTIRELVSNPGENQEDFLHQATAEMIAHNATNGTLQIDKDEFEHLPDKQTKSQINDEILSEVLQSLGKYLNQDEFLCKFGRKCGSIAFIAAQFKNNQMKTSLLSSAVIEAALTIIINRINDENYVDDERYRIVKQSPFQMSYIDDDEFYTKGVRVFKVKAKQST